MPPRYQLGRSAFAFLVLGTSQPALNPEALLRSDLFQSGEDTLHRFHCLLCLAFDILAPKTVHPFGEPLSPAQQRPGVGSSRV